MVPLCGTYLQFNGGCLITGRAFCCQAFFSSRFFNSLWYCQVNGGRCNQGCSWGTIRGCAPILSTTFIASLPRSLVIASGYTSAFLSACAFSVRSGRHCPPRISKTQQAKFIWPNMRVADGYPIRNRHECLSYCVASARSHSSINSLRRDCIC